MTRDENQNQYVFEQTVNEQREDYITNQLIAFNKTYSTALSIGQYDPLPLHIYALDRDETVLALV